MKVVDKQALVNWDELKKSLLESTTTDDNESSVEASRRITRLENNPEEWFKYYFPNFCTADPAPFHKAGTRRILNNPEWYEVRAWSRELAKSTRTMMEVLYLAMTGKKRNILLISNSSDNAIRLITPYKIILEANRRIIKDYGTQEKLGSWEAGEFITAGGVAFRALGAGQSPRGTRNENIRPDAILIDDIDTDEDCRNPEVIEKRWTWIEKALIPTRSISVPLLLIFCGNIIAEDCCIVRAIEKADKADIINIRTNGKSSWPQKNSEEHIDRVLSQISYAAAQGEYFNNPITEGKVFKELVWGKVPPLNKFPFLVAYGDPSPSNKETSKNSYKTIVLVGRLDNKFYVIKTFLEQTTNSKFVNWYYDIKDLVREKTMLYFYLENNTLQDPFFQQVFKPLFFEKGRETGYLISIMPDDRKKPDKYARIEGTLEPIHRMGCLQFNEDEKNNPHMQRLVQQFKAVSPKNKNYIDGPDATEGGVWIINNRLRAMSPTSFTPRNQNHKYRY